MARYRIYPTKNTTILEDYPTINTGENEVTELWYGLNGVTRYLVKFNTSEYVNKYNLGLVPHITATTASFVMQNCYPIFEDTEYATSVRASSCDLIVKTVQQAWDEGNGHDFVGVSKESGYCNWTSAATTTAWAAAGGDYVYTVFSGHIDKGYENLSGSVTNEIELWNVFTGTDHGLAVMYSASSEALTTAARSVLKFYTRHTNTYYKPYIQFDWDNQVTDHREEIYTGVSKRLYLYTKKYNTFTNIYSANSVIVTYPQNGGSSGWTATSINNPMKGIYYVEYTTPGAASAGTIFTDTWNITYESGVTPADVAQTGSIVSITAAWDTSNSDLIDPAEYDLRMPDLKDEYTKGSNIYSEIQNITKYTSTNNVLKTMDYRIDLVDGNTYLEMVPWEGVSYTTDTNFIMIDTDWFISGQTYELKFRYDIDGTLLYDTEKRKFKIT